MINIITAKKKKIYFIHSEILGDKLLVLVIQQRIRIIINEFIDHGYKVSEKLKYSINLIYLFFNNL